MSDTVGDQTIIFIGISALFNVFYKKCHTSIERYHHVELKHSNVFIATINICINSREFTVINSFVKRLILVRVHKADTR